MGQGKYSPNLPRKAESEYIYNCYGKEVAPWKGGDEYDEKTMFGDYDTDGFDKYGYSAFNSAGTYVGPGGGVDHNGYTDYDYMCMDEDQFLHGVTWVR